MMGRAEAWKEMKVYIQRPSDGRFLKSKTNWVRRKLEARCFTAAVDALAFSIAAQLGNIRLVVGDEEEEVVLHPFGDRPHAESGAEQSKRVVRSQHREMRREQSR